MNPSRFDRLFLLLAAAAVGTSAAIGFGLLGSPSRQRQLRADRQRVEDLRQMARSLQQLAQQSQDRDEPVNLPVSLPATARRRDPLSGQPYSYQRLDSTHYRLCAEFATNSAGDRLADRPSLEEDFWQHPRGRHCFQLNVLDSASDGRLPGE